MSWPRGLSCELFKTSVVNLRFKITQFNWNELLYMDQILFFLHICTGVKMYSTSFWLKVWLKICNSSLVFPLHYFFKMWEQLHYQLLAPTLQKNMLKAFSRKSLSQRKCFVHLQRCPPDFLPALGPGPSPSHANYIPLPSHSMLQRLCTTSPAIICLQSLLKTRSRYTCLKSLWIFSYPHTIKLSHNKIKYIETCKISLESYCRE